MDDDKKRVRGGFRGRQTAGTKTSVLGMVDVNLASRRCTGRCVLLEIPDRKAKTRRLCKHMCGIMSYPALWFSLMHTGYRWLAKKDSGYVHRCVNHKQKEFSRTEEIFGVRQVVTSNAAEGLFGRLKTWLRKKGVKKVGKNTCGHLLAEFLWWQHCGAGDIDLFSDLLCRIRDWQDAHPHRIPEPQSLRRSLPEELQRQFQSILRPEENVRPAVHPNAPIEPLHPLSAPVVPDVAAPPRVVPDVAAPWGACSKISAADVVLDLFQGEEVASS